MYYAPSRIAVLTRRRARFGATIAVLDMVNQAGIERVSVETKTRPTGK